MSEVQQLDLNTGDLVTYLPNGRKYKVSYIHKTAAGTPEIEPVYWLTPVGRIPLRESGPVGVPRPLSGHYLRRVTDED